ncbi:MAG TPA: YicC/YloC family endoribonuclease [Bacillota bacterium]
MQKGNQTLALSMTGYGRGTAVTAEYNITIDIKSINHRYLDLYFKLPRSYLFLEEKLRRVISGKVARGKLEVAVNIERLATPEAKVEFNRPLVAAYLSACKEMKNSYQLQGEVDLQSLISLPDVFIITQPEADQERLEQALLPALEEALKMMTLMRQAEGSRLISDLKQKLAVLKDYCNSLTAAAPLVVTDYQEKLTKRLQELTGELEIDSGRLAMEVAIFADRCDISEELTRLESHLQQFETTLDLNEPIGRKLDFLVQELNREVNTIGSKANDLQITQIVIDFKTELEKLREQIQNLE